MASLRFGGQHELMDCIPHTAAVDSKLQLQIQRRRNMAQDEAQVPVVTENKDRMTGNRGETMRNMGQQLMRF